MQSLGGQMAAGRIAADAAAALADERSGFVLPRLLRRPFRVCLRFINHGIAFSPRMVAAAGILVVGGAAAAGVVHGGRADDLIAQASALAGFRIADIEINGTREVSRIDVLTNIDLGTERSLFSFDVHKARDDLKRLAWVRDAAVSKAYPDRLIVDIVERRPFAVWQNGQALYVVGRDGTEIVPFDDRFAGLPLVVGKGGARRGAELIAAVERFSELAGKVKAYIRVGDRRWNLQFANGVTVLLPEFDETEGLARLARLEREEAILSRAVQSIDLRLPDRLVVRLQPDAAASRRDAVEDMIKQAKAREKGI